MLTTEQLRENRDLEVMRMQNFLIELNRLESDVEHNAANSLLYDIWLNVKGQLDKAMLVVNGGLDVLKH